MIDQRIGSTGSLCALLLNTGYHSSICKTPFEVVHGCPPPKLLYYCDGLSPLDAVDHELCTRDDVIYDLQDSIQEAQDVMKPHYDSVYWGYPF